MFDYDKWQEIFNTIAKHKLRTGLTALGVFWGIFMLVFLMGAGNGLQNGVNGLFGGHAKNSVYMGSNRTSLPYKGMKPGRYFSLDNDDVAAIRNNFEEEIAHIAPRLWMPAGNVSHGEKSASFDVRGDLPDLIHIDALEVYQGRFLNELDVKNKRKIAVVGREVVKALFDEEEEAIGAYIKLRGTKFKIVGVLKSNRRGEDAVEDEKTVLLPITTVQQLRNQPGQIGWFVCAMYPKVDVGIVEEKIKKLLKNRHNIHPDDQRAIWSDNIQEEYQQITGLFTGITVLVWFVGIGSLLAGVIGVGNIMLILVKERTKEIGIRKALGATPTSIISMILMESVFLTTIAGYLGLACSVGILFMMSQFMGDATAFFSNPEIDLGICLLALAILVICGALTGLIPAMQAANVNPVIALKDE